METYRRFLVREKVATFKSFTRVSPTVNSDKNKTVRVVVLRVLLEVVCQGCVVLFFDESSIQNYSVKNKGWFLKGKRGVVDLRLNYHSIKILAITSFSGVEALQFTSKSNGEIVCSFLREALHSVLRVNPERKIVLLLDNAKMNHGKSIKDLCQSINVTLVYNAVCSPHLNMIEHFFEFIKRDIRIKTNSSKYDLLKCLVVRAKRFDKRHVSHIWHKQQADSQRSSNGKISLKDLPEFFNS